MRVYLPATLAGLARFWAAGVVSDVERLAAADESEEAEYDALLAAADASSALLEGVGRRVVIVAETDAADEEPIPLRDVVAVHVDVEDVDPSADPDELPELGWYATQEIPALLA